MLLAFKLLVYTHVNATSPNFCDRRTEHDHQPTPWFFISICKSILQIWHSFIQVSSWSMNRYKCKQNKLHQTTYNWITGPNSKVWIRLYQQRRNFPTNCPLESIHKKSHTKIKHHVKMITHPLLITVQQNFGRDRNSSKHLEKEQKMMMVMNLQVIGSKIELGHWQLACTVFWKLL